MSAPAFAIPAAPFMGPAAAPKRGAAKTDADFASVLGETASAEAPAKAAAPTAPKKDVEVAPAPVEDAGAETDAEAAPVADTIVVPVPAPASVPAPTVVADVEIVSTETVTTAPAAEVPTAPTDDLVPANGAAEPNLAAADAADPNLSAAAKGAASADAPVAPPAPLDTPASAEAKPAADLTAPAPEQPKAASTPQGAAAAAAAAAAVVATPVTPPAPRPAKASETVTPVDTASSDETPVVTEAAPLEAPAAPAEAPRTRDVIDRALTGRADGQGVSKDAAATADATPQTDGAEPAARSPQPAAARPAVAEPAVLTLQGADDAVVAAPVIATGQPVEARAAEPAVSLALSTVSHASIETTAQIAAQIVKKLEGRSVRFEMALTPEGLGNVDVSLDIDADGKLIAKMAFDNPLAATELRGRVDELRRQLQESGFTVADDALTFSERDASAGQHGGSAFDNRPDPRSARAFGAGARLSAEADIAVPSRWIPLTLTPDRVDMKV